MYAFPFLNEERGMQFESKGAAYPCTASPARGRPTLGFVGIQLAVPCPIPTLEAQSRYLGEAGRPVSALTRSRTHKLGRPTPSTIEASGREQDPLHNRRAGAGRTSANRRVRLLSIAPGSTPQFDALIYGLRTRDRGAPPHKTVARRFLPKVRVPVDWARGEWDVAC